MIYANKEWQHVERVNRDTDAPNTAPTVILVSPIATAEHHLTWAYMIVQRHVSGWNVVAQSVDYGTDHSHTAASVGEMLRTEFGTGFDYLPASRTWVNGRSKIGCIRREGSGRIAYCGKPVSQRAEFHNRATRIEQHCVGCDTAWRSEHYGRCPITCGDDDTIPCGHVPDDECACAMTAAEVSSAS
jgi:hypothetical protein